MRVPLFSLLFLGADRTVAAISTFATVAPVTTSAAVVAARTIALHHRGRASLMLVDADGHEADDVLVAVGLALELGDRRRGSVDVEHHEMRLAVLGDLVDRKSTRLNSSH